MDYFKYQHNNKIEALLKALAYSDIFDFPLTKQEIHKFCPIKISAREVDMLLEEMCSLKIIEKKGKYYNFFGRNLAHLRNNRQMESELKMDIAKKVISIISYIPTIRLVGISGSLSVGNSKKEDDIDLFFITRKNTLWITRIFVTGLLFLLGKKRQKGISIAENKICANMFISEDSLMISKMGQNLFIAREIVQLNIITNKNKTYEQFLSANKWVLDYLPNSFKIGNNIDQKNSSANLFIQSFQLIMYLFELFFYSLQKLYMSKSITNEKIEKNLAKFHPDDRQNKILESYKKRYKQYDLLTLQKNFDNSKNRTIEFALLHSCYKLNHFII